MFNEIMRVSTLSLYDHVAIAANFHYLYDKNLQCKSKIRKAYDRIKDWTKAREFVSEQNGCGIYQSQPRYEIDGICYHKCLSDFKHPSIDFFLWAHEQYTKGILPFEGNLLEQPNYIMEVFRKLDYLKAEHEAELHKAAINGK